MFPRTSAESTRQPMAHCTLNAAAQNGAKQDSSVFDKLGQGPSRKQVPARVFATEPRGRLGVFGSGGGLGEGLGQGGLLLGSARMAASEVAVRVAGLLDQSGDVGMPPPSIARPLSSCSIARPLSSCGATVALPTQAHPGNLAGNQSPSVATGTARAEAGESQAALDGQGKAIKVRFGQNGATWRMSHGVRPITASRHKAMGFNPEVGRHAPLLTPSLGVMGPLAAAETAADDFCD